MGLMQAQYQIYLLFRESLKVVAFTFPRHKKKKKKTPNIFRNSIFDKPKGQKSMMTSSISATQRPLCYSCPKFRSITNKYPSPSLPKPTTMQTPISNTTNNTLTASSLVAKASSATNFAPDIGDILADVSIFTCAGDPVRFRDLWDQNEGIAVVALLRHFGCPCCWELASALKEAKPRFDAAGVKLVAVGVGTPNKAVILAERLSFPMDCLYADPDHKAYDILGLYYGFARTFFNPASAKVFKRFKALQQAVKNYTITATPDDRSSVLQQGGMFVFKGKQLLYARKDEGTGDHAPLDDILDICCKVPAA
ncbi:AhpC-TSA_2 domain-containing protein [Cephalotus follicularis]|uniref:AhpC-TSA_2 domain-containing protein n=1 Tax=Cephalotus follicularis TaxID=3775 RepID=A0A1Q3BMJ1_CEPFO|nr:AhpC-TSA_2 domain-containing protein [Cephalotus follicularis]